MKKCATCIGGRRAVLLPGEEDFGIVPVEAQACGRPVVALGRGGALETVDRRRHGLLVDDADDRASGRRRSIASQRPRDAFDRGAAFARNAERFSRERFMRRFRREVQRARRRPARRTARW